MRLFKNVPEGTRERFMRKNKSLIEGTFIGNERGFGFVIPECETDYAAFQQEMRKTEDKLVQEILS